jgi:hypothetical protein
MIGRGRHQTLAVGLLAAAGVLAIGVGTAAAQYGPGGHPPPPPPGYGPPPAHHAPPPPGIHRSGFIIGFSLGGGSMIPDCSECDSLNGPAFAIHLGGMVAPNLALMWDGSGVAKHDEYIDATLVNAVNTFAVQYWPTSMVWIKGGIGFGRLTLSSRSDRLESDTKPAVLAAAGVEVLQTRSFALDLSVRLVPVFYDDFTLTNASLNLGFNWY